MPDSIPIERSNTQVSRQIDDIVDTLVQSLLEASEQMACTADDGEGNQCIDDCDHYPEALDNPSLIVPVNPRRPISGQTEEDRKTDQPLAFPIASFRDVSTPRDIEYGYRTFISEPVPYLEIISSHFDSGRIDLFIRRVLRGQGC